MKKLFVILLLTFQIAQAQEKITTFILVRHAEKTDDGKDPDLSEQGEQRVVRLSDLLKNTSLAAVYSTKFKRTQNTVAGIAHSRNLVVTSYESLNTEELKKLSDQNAGGTILIAGHSNTIPQIANLLIGRSQFAALPESEYGTILIIPVLEVGKTANVLTLHY